MENRSQAIGAPERLALEAREPDAAPDGGEAQTARRNNGLIRPEPDLRATRRAVVSSRTYRSIGATRAARAFCAIYGAARTGAYPFLLGQAYFSRL